LTETGLQMGARPIVIKIVDQIACSTVIENFAFFEFDG
jgi:hypothetical protein